MDLHELSLFIHLADTLHFGKTSSACHISPSALSRTIQRLEEEAGERLFIRDNRSVKLSEAGVGYREFARETIDRWETYRSSRATGEGALRGELRLFCSVTASYGVLADLFESFRADYPEVHIRLQTGDAAHSIENVVSGAADLTVAAKPERLPRNLRFKIITTTPLVFIAPVVPCEVSRTIEKSADPSMLPWRSMPMILAEQALSRRRVDSWFRAKGIHPNVYAEVAGHEAILSMVRLGCGIGVVPELVVENSLFKDEIRVLDISPALEPYQVGLCVHNRRLPLPVVKAFWDSV